MLPTVEPSFDVIDLIPLHKILGPVPLIKRITAQSLARQTKLLSGNLFSLYVESKLRRGRLCPDNNYQSLVILKSTTIDEKHGVNEIIFRVRLILSFLFCFVLICFNHWTTVILGHRLEEVYLN